MKHALNLDEEKLDHSGLAVREESTSKLLSYCNLRMCSTSGHSCCGKWCVLGTFQVVVCTALNPALFMAVVTCNSCAPKHSTP